MLLIIKLIVCYLSSSMSEYQEDSELKEFKESYDQITKIYYESCDLFDDDLLTVVRLISERKYQEAIKLILEIRNTIEEFKINSGNISCFLGDGQWNGVIDKLLAKYGSSGLIKKFGEVLIDPKRPYHLRLIYADKNSEECL